ncbi:hypothetical protein LCGC14_2812960 [marine sediment metagenome]|uniref:Uncharacterized protein n=1 Tax=marine sediment metagenome TaxID=412755 RepID=A0A0F9ASS5_9ZZZZ
MEVTVTDKDGKGIMGVKVTVEKEGKMIFAGIIDEGGKV